MQVVAAELGRTLGLSRVQVMLEAPGWSRQRETGD
jgi:hypothetical protein